LFNKKLQTNKKDNTRNERQSRRREREKQWLKENGWQSWEALYTALMNGTNFYLWPEKTYNPRLKKRKIIF